MKTFIITNQKMNRLQLFWLHLQMTWKIRAAVPAFLTDSAWSGTLEPDGTLIGMTIDTRRGHLLEMSRSQLVIYDLQTGKRLRTLQPDWIGQVAYHPDDVLIVSGSERTWVVSAETFEILHEHPWGGWVSKDGSKVITQEHEQGVHDAISGQVLCTLEDVKFWGQGYSHIRQQRASDGPVRLQNQWA